MKVVSNVRRLEKRTLNPLVIPTIPASDDHTDGSWIETDIYEGELFFNLATEIAYTRKGANIVELGVLKHIDVTLDSDEIKTGNSVPIEVDVDISSEEVFEVVSASAFMLKDGDAFDSTDISLITDTASAPQAKTTYDPSLAENNVRFQIVNGGNQLLRNKKLFIQFDADSNDAPLGSAQISIAYRKIRYPLPLPPPPPPEV